MGLDYFASAPVLTIPPQQPARAFADPPYAFPDQSIAFQNHSVDVINHNGQPGRSSFSQLPSSELPKSVPPTPSENSIAGRKRSRADIFEADEDDLIDGSYVSQPVERPKPPGEPVYGPGMTLIYPDDPIGFHICAESQTGTWAEERQNTLESSRADGSRPVTVSRKSQMRVLGSGARAQSQSSLPRMSPTSAPAVQNPFVADDPIDTAKLYLGVGWKRVAENPDLADAARGWGRFIENHYRLHNVAVLLYSEGQNSYLVQASEDPLQQPSYCLFSEDLTAGRMLASTLEGVVHNLSQSPTQFDGGALEFQERTPPPQQPVQEPPAMIMAVDGHVDDTTAAADQDVDMML